MKSRFLPNGLLGRFILITLLPLIIVQFSLGIIFYNRHWDTISHRLARDIFGEVELVANFVNESQLPLEELKHLLMQAEQSLFLDLTWYPNSQISTKHKKRLLDMNEALTGQLARLKYPYQVTTSTDGQQRISIQLDKGVLEVVVARKRFFSTTVWVFFIWMILSSAFWFGVAMIFMKNQSRS